MRFNKLELKSVGDSPENSRKYVTKTLRVRSDEKFKNSFMEGCLLVYTSNAYHVRNDTYELRVHTYCTSFKQRTAVRPSIAYHIWSIFNDTPQAARLSLCRWLCFPPQTSSKKKHIFQRSIVDWEKVLHVVSLSWFGALLPSHTIPPSLYYKNAQLLQSAQRSSAYHQQAAENTNIINIPVSETLSAIARALAAPAGTLLMMSTTRLKRGFVSGVLLLAILSLSAWREADGVLAVKTTI